jgi:hypothetical protein
MSAGTGEPEPGIDLSKIREHEERLDNFRIQADSDITVVGSAWQGYAVNIPSCSEEGEAPTPPTGCPCVTFSSVEYCCDSEDSQTGLGDYPGHPEFSFNDRVIRQNSATNTTTGCTFCTNPFLDCDGNGYEIAIFDCEGNLTGSTPFVVWTVFLVGLWHIMAQAGGVGFIFYGTTTDIGVPADNQLLSCDFSGGYTLDNPLMECVFGTAISDSVYAFNGTATLSDCGPCP